MKISDLMEALGEAQAKYGDVEVSTFDDTIREVHLSPTDKEGCLTNEPDDVTCIVIDVLY